MRDGVVRQGSLVDSCCQRTIFMVFRKNWAYIFNDDIEVVQLVGRIMPLVALFQACIIFASPLDAADLTASDI